MLHKLTLGFSPCPNDCFIFDALVHKKIDTLGFDFEVQLLDVETLNQKAFKGELDISKLSFHALLHLSDKYNLLDAGAALGFGCGPLLVQKAPLKKLAYDNSTKVAIPGHYTTANLLFSIAYPHATNKVEMLFSEIEDAVIQGKVDAGVIIHENRFTYQDKGLEKIVDLGEYWEKLSNSPIPLGCIAIKNNIDEETKQQINSLIRKSVEYAFAIPEQCMEYVRAHAQEMSEEVMKKHIALYVNKYSLDLGEEGKRAVNILKENMLLNKII